MAGLARENQEAALKELGRLLENAREAATEDRGGTGGDQERPLNTAALATWDRSKEEGQQFARVMVSRTPCSPSLCFWNLTLIAQPRYIGVYGVRKRCLPRATQCASFGLSGLGSRLRWFFPCFLTCNAFTSGCC